MIEIEAQEFEAFGTTWKVELSQNIHNKRYHWRIWNLYGGLYDLGSEATEREARQGVARAKALLLAKEELERRQAASADFSRRAKAYREGLAKLRGE